MPREFKDVWKALRNAMIAESELAAKVDGRVYRQQPKKAPNGWPWIAFRTGSRNPQTQVDGVGLWRPSPTIDVFSLHPDDGEDVVDVIEQRFSIPVERDSINADGFEITKLRIENVVEVGPLVVDEVAGGDQIWQHAMPCSMTVRFA